MQMSSLFGQQAKPAEIEEDEEEIEEDDDEEEEGNESLIIVDENHQQDEPEPEPPKRVTNSSRSQNNHLRCRQCDYEADDLSDLLVHRKAHASMKYNQPFDQEEILADNSDIENGDDDEEEADDDDKREAEKKETGRMFDYELLWLENNPLIKQLTTIREKTRTIVYQCSKCNYAVDNNRQHLLNHLHHQHPEFFEQHL